MAINFLGYEVENFKWGAKFGQVSKTDTRSFSKYVPSGGTIGGTIIGGSGSNTNLGGWSVNVSTAVPTIIPRENIIFSTSKGTITNVGERDGYWLVTIEGTTLKTPATITGELVSTYLTTDLVDPGQEIKTIYFNNQQVYPTDYYTYELLDDDTYSVSYRGGATSDMTLSLPQTYNGKSVTKVYDFSSCPVKSIYVPSGYTIIDEFAFEYSSIESITLPSTLEYIYNSAFSECSNLKKVNLGGCISILDSAFSDCVSLEFLSLPEGLKYIGTDAFYSCNNLKYLYIPSTVTDIDGPLNSDAWDPYIYCGVLEEDLTFTSSMDDSASAWYVSWAGSATKIEFDWQIPQYISYDVVDGGAHIYYNSASQQPEKICLPIAMGGYLVTGVKAGGFKGKNYNDQYIGTSEIYVPHNIKYFGTGAFENQTNLLTLSFTNEEAIAEEGILSFAKPDSMSVPFIGRSKDATGYQSGLGYWFSTASNRNETTHYLDVPNSLDTIVINSDWKPGANQYTLYNCAAPLNLILSPSTNFLHYKAFYNCGLESFPVDLQYWRWELLDSASNLSDYGGWDTKRQLSAALSKLKSGEWTNAYAWDPEVPRISATRSGGKITATIHNPYPRQVKFAVRYSANYAYGSGESSRSPYETGTIPAYGNVTTTFTFSSKNIQGASLTNAEAAAWFNDYQSKTATATA